MTRDDIRRFWTHVDRRTDDECWPWLRSRNSNGYGAFYINRVYFGAHRVAWTATSGPIPPGMHVLHRCDNRPCCNPSHLFLGTQQDNNADMLAKKRNKPIPPRRGSRHHNAKLTETSVDEIRQRVASGTSQTALAREYGVSRIVIRSAVLGLTWAHVKASYPDRRRHDKKGRPYLSFGEANGHAKLSAIDVAEIRKLANAGISQSEIGRHFGIRQCHVSRIVMRQSWKHVP